MLPGRDHLKQATFNYQIAIDVCRFAINSIYIYIEDFLTGAYKNDGFDS